MIARVFWVFACVWVILRVFCVISNLLEDFEGVVGGFYVVSK